MHFNNNRVETISIKTRCLLYVSILMLVSTLSLSGCNFVKQHTDEILSPDPSSETVLLTIPEISEAVENALKNGEAEISLDVVATNEEIQNLTENLSPFWGAPHKYTVLKEYQGIEIERDGNVQTVDVKRIIFSLKQSINYYLYNDYVDPNFVIPEDEINAIKVAEVLPSIINEIFPESFNSNASAYEKALAVHNWLVGNLQYDEAMDMASNDNGTYGALIGGTTMCQGYSEALTLILMCATDVESKVIVGEANDGSGEWIGHAWNLVYMEDAWYHVDSTFSDPVGNPSNQINHFYFGQNDEFMSNDHKWDPAFWPAADGENFLFYRKEGLFANNLDSLQQIIKTQLNNNPLAIEIVANGFEIPDDDLQFIFRENTSIASIYRSQLEFDGVIILHISFEYK